MFKETMSKRSLRNLSKHFNNKIMKKETKIDLKKAMLKKCIFALCYILTNLNEARINC